jgi:excisionase family DNA binding protein
LKDRQTQASTHSGLFSLNDVAEYLSCSRTHAHKLISNGSIPSLKLGTLRRVRKSDLDAYIESRLAAKG